MQIATIGLDLAKHVFQIHGIDAAEKVVVREQLRRSQVMAFFEALSSCLIGMEACATAHYWARELTKLGHEVRLMPAKDVKAYVKRTRMMPLMPRRSARRSDANHALRTRQVGRAAGSVDAASNPRSADAPTDPGDQCFAGAYGRTRYCGGARAGGDQGVAGDHCG